MNDQNGLSERLRMLGAAVSSRPSLLDDVMGRINEAPQPVRRRSRWKLIAGACLAASACLVVSVVAWMTIGGHDQTETAAIDGPLPAVQPAKKQASEATDAFGPKLFERENMNVAGTRAERSRGGVQSGGSKDLGVQQKERGRAWNGLFPESCGEAFNAAFGGTSSSKPQLSDFAGLWRGTATDKPEDGTSTDPVAVKLTISQTGQLEGIAFDRFAGGAEAPLEDVYVVGDRIEFKVHHRTGVKMQVTLAIAADTLKGDAIPIRSDESRCDVVLQRQRPESPPPAPEPSKP